MLRKSLGTKKMRSSGQDTGFLGCLSFSAGSDRIETSRRVVVFSGSTVFGALVLVKAAYQEASSLHLAAE